MADTRINWGKVLKNNLAYFIAIVASLLILGADFFSDNIEIQGYFAIILIVLDLLAVQSIIEREQSLNKIEKSLLKVDDNTKISINQFETSINQLETSISQTFPYAKKELAAGKDWYQYVTYRIRKANKSIYDASLASRLWNKSGTPQDKELQNAREEAYGKTSDSLIYKYLTVFRSNYSVEEINSLLTLDNQRLLTRKDFLQGDLERIEMIQKNLGSYSHSIHNYSVRYLPQIKFKFPALSFWIIDEEELILGFYPSEFDKGASDTALVICDKKIVDLFIKYFNYLWSLIASKVDHKEDLEVIKTKLVDIKQKIEAKIEENIEIN